MWNQIFIVCICLLGFLNTIRASEIGPLDSSFQFSIERSVLDGLSLGDEPTDDRLVEQTFELEFDLEYQLNNRVYLFFIGAFFDETETLKTINQREELSGLERKELGLGYFFGNSIQSELNIGRMEFSSTSDWFLWWDEEMDGVRLKSTYGDVETMLGFTEELARESTAVDFIDPEQKSVKRALLSLDWEFVADHSLTLYYLDQTDDSRSLNVGEFEDFGKIDEIDADLSWSGLSYFGEFDHDTLGQFAIEIHSARVSGNETVYEFDDLDPASGLSEVAELTSNSVNGSAQSYLLGWTPSLLQDWTFLLGSARGSGDRNSDNRRIDSFRQTGLQDDAESFGELYQPELSNLQVDVLGIKWQASDTVEVSVLSFDYRQRELSDEMRDVSIEFDPTGLNRDLGSEIDLIVMIEAEDGLEFILTAAEFSPGRAYGGAMNENSSYVNLELVYEF